LGIAAASTKETGQVAAHLKHIFVSQDKAQLKECFGFYRQEFNDIYKVRRM
jgi:hypothetical protein